MTVPVGLAGRRVALRPIRHEDLPCIDELETGAVDADDLATRPSDRVAR
ncbi:MAG: hypothetical protein HYX34_14945 [Actinobacteria bacterium]|nr:hypothetical protein [Actinomycetota bacterium]